MSWGKRWSLERYAKTLEALLAWSGSRTSVNDCLAAGGAQVVCCWHQDSFVVCIRQGVCLRDRWSCAFVTERSNNALSHCTCAHIYGRSGAVAQQLQEHGHGCKFQLVLVKAPAR